MKNAFLILLVAPLLMAAAGPPLWAPTEAPPAPLDSPADPPAVDIDDLLGQLLAGPPPGYYDGVDDSTPETLRATLHETIDDHTWYPYSASTTDTWDILESADEDPNNPANILDLYKNSSLAKFGGGNGPYNREHVWPNSYGFPDRADDNYPYTDCHHLFLCDVSYNGDRANTVFRDCSAACTERPTIFNDGEGGGSGSYPGNSNWFSGNGVTGSWETWIGRRGDVARAILYMDVRYEGGTHGVTGFAEPDLIVTDDESLIAASSTGNNESVAYMGMRSVLLEWHLADPPDDKERHRNDVIYSYQGNRNPFIDHPEWFAPIAVPVKEAGMGGLKARFRH
jgi:endonuclease I